jgi:hypothetical protein
VNRRRKSFVISLNFDFALCNFDYVVRGWTPLSSLLCYQQVSLPQLSTIPVLQSRFNETPRKTQDSGHQS